MACIQNILKIDEMDDDTLTVVDDDSCTEEELNKAFSNLYNLLHEEKLELKSTYMLHLDGNSENSVAAGLSDDTIRVYDLEGRFSKSYSGHGNSITGLRFSPRNPSILYSSSLDARIKVWDLREKDKTVAEFIGSWKSKDGVSSEHEISAFDVCNRDRVLVGGTECVLDDSFLLFWDLRAPGAEPMGGYWESHKQDITQVKFHHSQSDLLASGSMDGLINIFDIRQSCEDDALSHSLNTDSSVNKIKWLNDKVTNVEGNEIDLLSCITYEETLQIWQTDEVSPTYEFDKDKIAEALKVKSSEDCYLVDVYNNGSNVGETLILSGSTKSECQRLLCLKDGLLESWARLQGTKQVIRCCWANQKNGLLVTGGEGGVISFWRPGKEGERFETANKESHKIKVNKRSHLSTKPY